MTTVHVRIGEDSWHLNHRCRSVSDDRSYAVAMDGLRSDKGSHWEEGRAGRVSKKHPTPFRYKRECAVTLKPTPTHCNTDPLNTSDGIKSSFFQICCFFSKPGTVKTNPVRVSEAGLRVHRDNCNHFSGQLNSLRGAFRSACMFQRKLLKGWSMFPENILCCEKSNKHWPHPASSCLAFYPIYSIWFVFSQGMPNNVCFYFLQLHQMSTFQHRSIWNGRFLWS